MISTEPLPWKTALADDDGWLNNGLPFIDHVFPNGKTGRENARDCLKEWAKRNEGERRIDQAVKSMREQ